jgi:predicted house-cleaning noncanonical NTP pyrophosphatase (MazG superfamily)
MRKLRELQRRIDRRIHKHEKTAWQVKSEIILSEFRYLQKLAHDAVEELEEFYADVATEREVEAERVNRRIAIVTGEYRERLEQMRRELASMRLDRRNQHAMQREMR